MMAGKEVGCVVCACRICWMLLLSLCMSPPPKMAFRVPGLPVIIECWEATVECCQASLKQPGTQRS